MITENSHFCTFQVDVDGYWAINKLLNHNIYVDPDPVFELGIGRLLALFDEFEIKATFFISAKDLESEKKVEIIKKIIKSGHEIASHGYSHSYLISLPENLKEREVFLSKKYLESILGVKMCGFRAPGFAIDRNISRLLENSGYEYDCSVFGSCLVPCLELFTGLSYLKWPMMRSPAAPYRPLNSDIFKKGKCRIVEIPVTTIPFLRLPIHFSYLMLGGKYYAQLVCMVLKKTYARLRFINYLFHPLDLMNSQDVWFAKKIFGLNIPLAVKLALAKKMLKFFKANYQIVTSKEMYEVVKETV